MKRFYISRLAILAVTLLGLNMSAYAQPAFVSTFAYTGAAVPWTVPGGVFSIQVDMKGGQGGTPSSDGSATGGGGGRVQAKLTTTPGTVLYFYVGGAGTAGGGSCGCSGSPNPNAGGYNGGAVGYGYGSGGGGATDIRTAIGILTSRLLVAGGGGGGGRNCTGNYGGGAGGYIGQNGYYNCGGVPDGGGATQTAGGAGGNCGNGSQGNPGTLGVGGSPFNSSSQYYGPGGGGGGYYGGGGGTSYGGGGGGGSSWGDTVAVAASKILTPSFNTSGNGSVTFTSNCTSPVSGAVVGPTIICGTTGGPYLYSDPTATPGGVWLSSNTTVATIDPNTGIMNTVSTGAITISYSCNFSCGIANSLLSVTVNPLPQPILGGPPVVCQLASVTLTNSSPGVGTWSSSNTGLATINSTGSLTGVLPGNPIITYTAATGCTTSITATVNANPAPITSAIPGVFQLCFGTTLQLNDATPGGAWTSSNTTVATVGSAGLISTASANPAVQTTNITYALTPGTGCKVTQTVSVDPLPAQFPIFTPGNAFYCAGSAAVGSPPGTPGVDIGLISSTVGINYQLYQNGLPFPHAGVYLPGTGSALDWGNQLAGTYTAMGINTATGCTNTMKFNVVAVENPVPDIETVLLSGGGNVCAGAPVLPDVIIHPSQSGITYEIFANGGFAGGPNPGTTGSDLDFGPAPFAGTYTAIATTSLNCTSNMAGAPTIIVNPLPNVENVTQLGAGAICPGDPGPRVGISFSDPGINYELWFNGVPTGHVLAGASSALDFGTQSLMGTYTVVGTNALTGCTQNMNGSVVVSILPVPAVFNLYGGGSYCAGGTGVGDTLSNSEPDTWYKLIVSGVAIDSTPGNSSGTWLDLGLQTMSGTYTAIATNTVTGCSSNMTGSSTISISPLPNVYPVMGGGPYCLNGTGSDVSLGNSDIGINYTLNLAGVFQGIMPGTGSALDFGLQTLLGDYTVVAQNQASGCTNNMSGIANVSNYPLPNVYNVTGGGNYCIGSTGVPIGLDFSNLGVNYALWLNGTTLVKTLPGSSAALDFGTNTLTGTYVIIATNTTTSCSDSMNGTSVVTNSAPPTVYTITASGSSYCAGGTGVDIALNSSDLGINYQLFNSGVPVGLPLAGTGLALDYGMITVPGTYTIVAMDGGPTGCTSNMFGSAPLVINPLPGIYPVTGGGDYCAGGTGMHVGLGNSDPGIVYWLFNGITAITNVTGTGGPIDFGLQTRSGTYQVVAVNYTTTCTQTMGGSVVININPAPNTYPVTGGGALCAGSTGRNIGLGGSDVGITYQLYNSGASVGGAIPGTNAAIDFGVYAAAGNYTVIASNTASGCTSTMTGSKDITVNPLPVAFSVYGGGSFCAGTPGAHVFLSGSALGDNYQLYVSGVATGGTVTASGTYIDFGAQSVGGMYTVVSTDALTGCSATMTSGTSVTVNPAPPVYAVTGGGPYCAGGTGVHVGLSWSNAGINYQLYNGFTPVGGTFAGAGVALDFGLQTGTGAYTVVAKDAVTGCTSNMTGSETVSTMPNVTPTVGITTNTGSDTVCEGGVTQFIAWPVYGGTSPVYTWYVNGVAMISGDTFSYVPLNGDIVKVLMTSDYACVTATKAMNSDLMFVRPFETPAATLSINPGPGVCKGSTATYSVVPVNGGFSPSYTWFINNLIVATNTLTYSNVPNDGDVVLFMLGSSYPCRLIDTVLSNTYKLTVDPGVSPVVSILARPGTLLQPGQNDTLTATAINAGTAPTYQWSRNGAVIPGATNQTYISPYFYNNDSLSCEVTSSMACGLSSFNSVHITVRNVGVQTLTNTGSDIRVIPNPNKGTFTVKGSIGTVDEEVSLEITNMLGQVVYNSKVMAQGGNISQQVQLGSNLANGMYLLNVRSATETSVFHFVIEQ